MANTHYDPEMTLREARARYFQDNQFGAEGGYNDAWVDFKLGAIPMPFPNTAGRVRAVRFHDLHHILTGYATDNRGEFEISAWELGAGCRDMTAAWVLNLSGLASGVLLIPGRVFRAFVRGLGSRSLYGGDLEALLDRKVGEVRAEHVPEAQPPVSARAVALFAGSAAAGLLVGSVFLVAMVPMVPVGLLTGLLRRRAVAG